MARLVAHLSDLHFGRHDPAVVDALLASLAEARPDLVVVSGDLTQRARRHEFAAARAFLDRLGAPALVVPGNHDVPLYNVANRFLRPLARFRRYIGLDEQPLYRDGELAVLGVNTARSLTVKNGRVSFEQMGRIRAAFAGLPARCWRVLVTHHPLLPPDGAGRALETVGRAAPALAAVAEAGVELLLSGHHHRAFSGDAATYLAAHHAVLVAQAGTATSTRIRGSDPNSFNLLHFGAAELTVTILAPQGRRFAPRAAASYRRVAGAWEEDPAADDALRP
jgi:3',5'-cyclic AMP phosphodiesterase CpdA